MQQLKFLCFQMTPKNNEHKCPEVAISVMPLVLFWLQRFGFSHENKQFLHHFTFFISSHILLSLVTRLLVDDSWGFTWWNVLILTSYFFFIAWNVVKFTGNAIFFCWQWIQALITEEASERSWWINLRRPENNSKIQN